MADASSSPLPKASNSPNPGQLQQDPAARLLIPLRTQNQPVPECPLSAAIGPLPGEGRLGHWVARTRGQGMVMAVDGGSMRVQVLLVGLSGAFALLPPSTSQYATAVPNIADGCDRSG